MDIKDIAEEAYKKGYVDGIKQLAQRLKNRFAHDIEKCNTIEEISNEIMERMYEPKI